MLILALDTALDACAAGILDTRSGKLIGHESQSLKRGHAEALMPLIARVMQQAAIGYHDLDRIAVTTGPGSFTGLRVGLSAARGLALAADKPCIGVSTLAALAAPLISEGGSAPVLSAIDARHDQIYYQMVAGDGSSLVRPSVSKIDDALVATIKFGTPRIIGNAADVLTARWPADLDVPSDTIMKAAPEILWIGWLGAAMNPETAPARPYYLRAPDAKPLATAQPHAGADSDG